jgi:hypothetical protein
MTILEESACAAIGQSSAIATTRERLRIVLLSFKLQFEYDL